MTGGTASISPGDSVSARLEMLRTEAEAARAAAQAKIAEVLKERSGAVMDDEHDPEGTTLSYEWSLAKAELAAAEESISEVEAALGRLAAYVYGMCVDCGNPIAAARLAAHPEVSTCIACATARERRAS